MSLSDEYRAKARQALEQAKEFGSAWWYETRRQVIERDGTDATYADDPGYALAHRVLSLIEEAAHLEKRGGTR